MTASAAVVRPVLYLVPSHGRARPRPAVARAASPPGTLPALAAESTARVLGTMFGPIAAHLARRLSGRAPLVVRRGRPEAWAAAIAFLLAEEAKLFEYDRCTTRTSLARELESSLSTLRRRGAEIRAVLDPWDLDLPEPEIE